jgi:hypothetical protein
MQQQNREHQCTAPTAFGRAGWRNRRSRAGTWRGRSRSHHVVVLEGAAALIESRDGEGEVLDGAVRDGAAEGEEPAAPVLGPQLGLARRVGRELVAVEAVAGVDLHARNFIRSTSFTPLSMQRVIDQITLNVRLGRAHPSAGT